MISAMALKSTGSTRSRQAPHVGERLVADADVLAVGNRRLDLASRTHAEPLAGERMAAGVIRMTTDGLPCATAVMASRGSSPVSTSSIAAVSSTVRHIGPRSREGVSGTMPARTGPCVATIPTSALSEDG